MNDLTAFALQAGECRQIAPGLRRVLAPNPSALTGPGTNSYILGEGRVALIDPGPDDPQHLAALLAALAPGETVEVVIATHAHLDHTALIPRLLKHIRAPVAGFGPATAGANPALADMGGLGGGEGLDPAFQPDLLLPDGARISGPDWTLEAIHTPGHLGNHICLKWGDDLFSGDQAMGWATSIVSPPHGDMSDYMRSLDRMLALAPRVLYPGHGPEVSGGMARLQELVTHRRGRESQILTALMQADGTAAELAARIYLDLDARLLPAAARNVLAHLVDLEARSLAFPGQGQRIEATWRRG